MNRFTSKAWSPVPYSGPVQNVSQATAWRNLGSSLNALSFGFVATAILISMFLIMAIFEHLLRPRTNLRNAVDRSTESLTSQAQLHLLEKLGHPCAKPISFRCDDVSVLMPGQQVPTYIAQPAPLPCPREGVVRPYNDRELILV